VEELAHRAAKRAARGQLPVLEVGGGSNSYRRLFDADRYQFVTSPSGDYVDPLPVESGCFGVVLCSGVVERTPEPCEVLAELNRALDRAGRLFLSTPLVVSPRQPRPGSGRRADPLGLNYLLQVSGFELEDLRAVEAASIYAVVARKAPSSGRAIATRGRLCPPAEGPAPGDPL
jgi:SAM-dependent methyltransferase